MPWLHTVTLLLGFYLISDINLALATDPVDLGRSIYEKGIGRDGREIGAVIHKSISLKGAAIACIGCHGSDARGGGEAFVQAPDIRWLNLSKPYPARRIAASSMSYDQSSFSKVLRTGLTATDRRLDPIMPRFDLADDEINGLIVYLGTIDQPEHTEQNRLIILGLLPKSGQNTLADALDSKLKNCPTTENGSPITAIDMLYFDTPEDAMIKLNNRLSKNMNALVLAPFLLGWEQQYVEAMQHNNVPTVLPFSVLNPPDESNWVFPFPGLESQILALLKSAKAEGYMQLRIYSEPKNSLSTKLAAVAAKMASTYGMLEIINNSEAIYQKNKIAILWLKQFDTDQINQNSLKDELALIPAIFIKPSLAIGNFQGDSLQKKYIAYPYNPKIAGSSVWRTPIDVWAGAVCKFLSLVGEKSISRNKLPEILQWENDFFLYDKPGLDLLSNQVFIYKGIKYLQ
ncbi:hypothetical protein W03_14390 [Nitrosomonas sp. PY1]|uniref:c-type cytochrome n=1 Tax=Nitrosomonas sp. PY1 TaxID=1803906 RepID=UPI001FC7BCF1|nr:cytochrome c [Nitrosomonas sp. PY1]GKS69435.1 hypothetical protein W03_14390 [Nitrosomonas sp. PY1]